MEIDRSILEKMRHASNIREAVYPVRSYDVDAAGRVSVIALCNWMQDAARCHAAALGVSVRDLMAEGKTWVLSRMAVAFAAYPEEHDTIRLRTWPSGDKGLFALRDFILTDAGDRVVAAGVSAWLVIDMATRRPVRIAPFLIRIRSEDIGHVLSCPLDKLPEGGEPEARQPFSVRYRDLDLNQHVNNVSSIEWVLESIAPAWRQDHLCTGFEINFLGEAFAGDTVVSGCAVDGSKDGETIYSHRIVSAETEKELARARTRWRPAG